MNNLTDQQNLVIIKTIHTLIWLFFNLVIGYLFYAVLTDNVGTIFWLGIGAIILECLVLLAFKWTCPLTFLARKYSDSQRENFDIYLPNWLARHNKTIYSLIMLLLIVLYMLKN